MDIYTVTPQMLVKQGICSSGIFSNLKPLLPPPSAILGFTSAWFWWCCSSQNTRLWGTPFTPHFLTEFQALWSTCFLPSQCALCSAYFCDLHVAEIFVELNYFYTWAFHVASVLRYVSFDWRLGEICSPRSAVSFRYRGTLLWAECPLWPRGFPACSEVEMNATCQ